MFTELRYDPMTGLLYWTVDRRNVKKDTIAGSLCKINKYIKIMVNKKNYQAHRVCWYLHYGSFPTNQIDHINGVRHDNRICNLREATDAENRQNSAKRKDNSSGYTGVCWSKKEGKFETRIYVNNKKIFLGYFDSAELAHQTYVQAKKNYHKFNPVERKKTNYPLALNVQIA
jgi:hypothetical protein